MKVGVITGTGTYALPGFEADAVRPVGTRFGEALVTPGQSFNEDLTLWPTDYTVHAGHRLVLLVSTETLEWAKSKAYGLASDSPVVQIDYSAGQSYLTVPAAKASQAPFAP